jgi:hypothetical protein
VTSSDLTAAVIKVVESATANIISVAAADVKVTSVASASLSGRRSLADTGATVQYQVVGLPAVGSAATTAAATLKAVTPSKMNDAIVVSTTAYNAAQPSGTPIVSAITVSTMVTTEPTITEVAAPSTRTPAPTAKPTTSGTAAIARIGTTGLAVTAAALAFLGL